MTMNILALNPGSSTLKFARYRDGELVDKGVVEVTAGMGKAASDVLARAPVDAVGCRVVHGGARFAAPAMVDDVVLDEIRALAALAPLHNPLAVEVLTEARKACRVVAVFDTAFHQTLPDVAFTYAVPRDFGLRRYGFHGISHGYIASRLPRPRLVSCHLGNGASVCAIRDGKSIDTSMGLTPMEGLVMGTRSGDIDPGLILYLLRGGRSVAEVDDLLNHQSGLLGLSGISGDLRALQQWSAGVSPAPVERPAPRHGASPAETAGESGPDARTPRAELAMEVFAYRVAKYIGAYAVALEGLDAVAFTGGIGEHSASMRARVCRRLAFLGITLDGPLNEMKRDDERRISAGRVEVWVIPTDEEAEIARATLAAIS